ncbi:hypothetical protein [Paramagnetospirillum marisnigri]|uniref:hypothetical protein n=1 Tax=Paramagnetospirillum marisnigri TaxID=1285242 RepID=UPI0012E7CA4B|nr:hypothetical protein [Paramagnetospirillum marisnigri]
MMIASSVLNFISGVAIIQIIYLFIGTILAAVIYPVVAYRFAIHPGWGVTAWIDILCITPLSSFSLSRFLLSFFPAAVARNPVKGISFLLIIATWLCISAISINTFYISLAATNGFDEFSVDSILYLNVFSIIIFAFIALMSFRARRATLKGGAYILFLRRFAGRADRSILRVLQKATHDDVPIVMLSDPKCRAVSRDPLLLGFIGMSFLHPFISMPIYVSEANETWREAVERLISSAKMTVIDVSDISEAMAWELGRLSSVRQNVLMVMSNKYTTKSSADQIGRLKEFTNKIKYDSGIAVGVAMFLVAGIIGGGFAGVVATQPLLFLLRMVGYEAEASTALAVITLGLVIFTITLSKSYYLKPHIKAESSLIIQNEIHRFLGGRAISNTWRHRVEYWYIAAALPSLALVYFFAIEVFTKIRGGQ